MKENEIGLDAESAKIGDALFQMREEGRIGSGEVVDAGGRAFEGIKGGLVMVVLVALGKDAHANLVEWSGSQGGKRLLLQGFRLVDPGVGCSAKGKERRAIFVGEVIIVADRNGAVHADESGNTGKRSAAFVESRSVTGGHVAPRTDSIRHEANLVSARTIVEAVYINRAMTKRKGGG